MKLYETSIGDKAPTKGMGHGTGACGKGMDKGMGQEHGARAWGKSMGQMHGERVLGRDM